MAAIKEFAAAEKKRLGDLFGFSGSFKDGENAAVDTPQLSVSFIIVGLAALYFLAAKLGLKLAFLYPSASLVWPGTGIALAALLLFGNRVWPGIFFGAFSANLTTAGSMATSLGIAVGNTLEGLIGAYFVNRYANGRAVFDRARDTLKFLFLAAMLSTVVSATIGVASLFMGGFIEASDLGPIWFTWCWAIRSAPCCSRRRSCYGASTRTFDGLEIRFSKRSCFYFLLS
jgi:integral membrane sensor domain MASE1